MNQRLTTSEIETPHYDAATRFFVGIPIWIVIAFLVDSVGRSAEGMTGGTSQRMVTTLTSYLIIAYFLFSFICALTIETRRWRLRFGCAAHLLLIASFASSVIPDIKHTPANDLPDSIAILVILYALILFPWIITWVKFVLRGRVERETSY
jgi:hypothetical protein